MKRVREDDEMLVFADTPWLEGTMISIGIVVFAAISLFLLVEGPAWAALIFAVPLAMAGAGFALFVRRRLAMFDRATRTFVRREISVFGRRDDRLPLDRIVGVELQESPARTDPDGRLRSATFRCALILDAGDPLPLTEVWENGPRPREAVEAVRRWLGALDLGARRA